MPIFGLELIFGRSDLSRRLRRWESLPVDPRVAAGPCAGAHRDHHRIFLGQGEALAVRALDLVFAYRMFPTQLATPCPARVPLQVGDTVGLYFHPIGLMGIFFASRVCEIVDEKDDLGVRWRGFKYQTLAGHPELGEERFLVGIWPTGEVEYHMISWSTEGSPLLRALAPLARWLQNRINQMALKNVLSLCA